MLEWQLLMGQNYLFSRNLIIRNLFQMPKYLTNDQHKKTKKKENLGIRNVHFRKKIRKKKREYDGCDHTPRANKYSKTHYQSPNLDYIMTVNL